jgi:hypothetical protein
MEWSRVNAAGKVRFEAAVDPVQASKARLRLAGSGLAASIVDKI